ncbi:Retrotransposon-derived protein PEG10 [Rhizoctonia solani]|uniref:Retrotransposon-derived protein PEG10 n=1 Tax=Rhizoctonia solani TaxID=456999 RepID=A0A8H8P564_9AGAM|nr:Retrotransposon-derived protein PEG10 [Rhizoctonia solani]QRW24111.1 Retrotransposon-derived protein PEG10 [Rhizoctonia solani]
MTLCPTRIKQSLDQQLGLPPLQINKGSKPTLQEWLGLALQTPSSPSEDPEPTTQTQRMSSQEGSRRSLAQCLGMELPNPYKGDTRGWKATQWLDRMLLWVALHCHQFDKEEQMVNIIKGKGSTLKTIQALGAQFKEAFANPDAKQAAASELDWNKEAYIAQFTHGLHQIVKELLSTKDNIPKELETVFAAETLGTSTTSTSTTTTHQVHLLEDPNYVTLEERDCQWASGLCVKCGQKSHGIKQCPYRWKATIKETTKVAEDKLGKE